MKLTLTNADGVILQEWDLKDWNLTKSIARSALIDEIQDEKQKAVKRGES